MDAMIFICLSVEIESRLHSIEKRGLRVNKKIKS